MYVTKEGRESVVEASSLQRGIFMPWTEICGKRLPL